MSLVAGFTAFCLGALHALEPGHGKSALAAYAVGYRGDFRHVIVLGTSTALAHTATILILALIIGAAVSSLTEDAARRYVEAGSALLLLSTGAWLWRRAAVRRREKADCAGEGGCDCGKNRFGAEAANSGGQNDRKDSLGVVGVLGVSIGILPCPTALAVLMSAMTAGHFAGGIWTVCLFSAGIALTMCSISVAALYFADSNAMRRLRAFSGKRSWTSSLPIFSAWIIIGSGLVTLMRAFFDF